MSIIIKPNERLYNFISGDQKIIAVNIFRLNILFTYLCVRDWRNKQNQRSSCILIMVIMSWKFMNVEVCGIVFWYLHRNDPRNNIVYKLWSIQHLLRDTTFLLNLLGCELSFWSCFESHYYRLQRSIFCNFPLFRSFVNQPAILFKLRLWLWPVTLTASWHI